MRFGLLLIFTILLKIGFSSPDLDYAKNLDKTIAVAIDESELQKRIKGGVVLVYAKNEESPYTGWMRAFYSNNQIERLSHWQAGKEDGLTTHWHENGQKKWEANFKKGKQDGFATIWHKNGQKEEESNFKNGKPEGIIIGWYDNGQKREQAIWNDGKRLDYQQLGTKWTEKGES